MYILRNAWVLNSIPFSSTSSIFMIEHANSGVMSCFWPQQLFKINIHYLPSLLYIRKYGHVFKTSYTKEPV